MRGEQRDLAHMPRLLWENFSFSPPLPVLPETDRGRPRMDGGVSEVEKDKKREGGVKGKKTCDVSI